MSLDDWGRDGFLNGDEEDVIMEQVSVPITNKNYVHRVHEIQNTQRPQQIHVKPTKPVPGTDTSEKQKYLGGQLNVAHVLQ
jgi:hypothetical protein